MTKPNGTIVACFTIALFSGVFLWLVPAWLFNALLVGVVISTLALVWVGVVALARWAGRLSLIYPDENGNFPIKMVWRFVVGWRQFGIEVTPINLNLIGSNSFREWATWQVTNNKRASQPKELMELSDQPQTKLITGPGQSLVIDAVMQDL